MSVVGGGVCVCRVSLYDTVHKIPTIIGQLQGYAGPHEALIKEHFIDVFEGAKPRTIPHHNHRPQTITTRTCSGFGSGFWLGAVAPAPAPAPAPAGAPAGIFSVRRR